MTRPRLFDEATVLQDAMGAFRRAGFAGASIKDLADATGLTSGSIYNAFGDKEGLYRAAFSHYIDAVIRHRIETYVGEAGDLDGLEQLFLSLLRAPECDEHGCLLTNAAVEFGARPSVASEGLAQGFAVLEAAIRGGIERQIGGGQVELLVVRLLLLYQGILVLIRAGRNVSACQAVIRSEFEQLRKLLP
ncbi:TetR/AcrR family transcriptional regulator [Mesorhizobium sp. M9A.F.Ca.ET.002.03.1.2]|uniref:TetR/AcrR family transcriptional regulator n=1 Tax=Mesorhizobium sp. M9A.F.Ca.ET.002.03.1.2 TaxID=2493668 RepID=UPI000F75C1BB|nr:TetR/AcrR family transcriptional regulator [Mesorhizobium sp. M9A.F.Ca.ET.002.03.1.2]AZN96508.1 TetR/AcrR family transcriptional regulator [Mesorhizobium sp. M9A.F.Ca.ET.002.03.1.2]